MTSVICACGANFFLSDGDTVNCSQCRASIRCEGQHLRLLRWNGNTPALSVRKTIQPDSSSVDFSAPEPAGQVFGRNHTVPPANNFVLIVERPVSELDKYKEANKKQNQKFLEEELPEQAPWAQKARE